MIERKTNSASTTPATAKKQYKVDLKNIKIRDMFGYSHHVSEAFEQLAVANLLINQWEEMTEERREEIRFALNGIALLFIRDNAIIIHRNPKVNWIVVKEENALKLFNAGIIEAVEEVSYDAVFRRLFNGYSSSQLKFMLDRISTQAEILKAFEAFADRFVLHNFGSVKSKSIPEEKVSVIKEFVENNKELLDKFCYDFDLRNLLGHEHETRGESTIDARDNIVHGASISRGGDFEDSEFEQELKRQESEFFFKLWSGKGYTSNWLGLVLSRILTPYIIVASVNSTLKVNMSIDEIASYLKHRGNVLLLENLQKSAKLYERFIDTMNLSDCSAREAFKKLIKFVEDNERDLTEEGIAVLQFIRDEIKPMLNRDGIYMKEGGKVTGKDQNGRDIVTFDRIITYDKFFENQLQMFGRWMSEPRSMPSIIKAFLVNSMFGAGKRRNITDPEVVSELSSDKLELLDKAFNDAFIYYNRDGSFEEIRKKEQERFERDSQPVFLSLDALASKRGKKDKKDKHSSWEEYMRSSYGDRYDEVSVDSTCESVLAILEAEGLGVYGK